ncbi:DUF1549 and DUF1553 domain-containing protein [Gimesia panareensis]|uniref:DUF1549 and DUF1553 domain-containing protein n=1 Tax=Gimesia panareensis TaxID=2527978 RepID=UPI00118B4446|nr:DUF1549 and DUF1553 domain-containing protein [Gimesia panareensis]QDU48849.1 Bacterial Ig-like domain (group 2) [Gimesia panareensis]
MDFRIKGSRTPQILMLSGMLALFLTSGPGLTEVRAAAAEKAQVDYKEIQIGPHAGGFEKLQLRGPDSRQQVIVTGVLSNGKKLDVTREVTYKIENPEMASITSEGYLTPLKDGETRLIATSKNGKSASIPVTIGGIAKPDSINFKNQVVPIFTKLTCNSGGCHGKASGQNGFKLSLLGFYPEDDYEFLVKEGRGRRLFPTSPAESLLLMKGTGITPHGGGKLVKQDSYEYRLLYRWIEQGMPYGNENDRSVASIKCYPPTRTMGQEQEQQISVIATYSDGSTEDVTRMALFEANDTEMAEVNKTGLVKTLKLSGEVAIMARYQGQVSTFRATIPLGVEVANLPKSKNLIDEAVFGKLKELGIPPSPVADDATFMRRVYIDITGGTPSEDEVQKFLADKDPAKRDKLIDKLIDSPAYADYFANKWNMVLRNKKLQPVDIAGTNAFYQWIWDSLYENKPYNEFVGDILSASGEFRQNPAVVWYREVNTVEEQVEDTAQLFLGLRIQCARCHHHPFEKWSQDDYYGLAAFFSRVGTKDPTLGSIGTRGFRDQRVYHKEGVASAKNIRSGENLKPTALGMQPMELSPERDPRVALVQWLSRTDNPFFAKALVNRYWKHFFGRGIVEPEDDMRATNPPANPELLDGLAKHFVESGFDLKELVRQICRSNAYQLSSLPNEYNLKDKQNFSRYYPKRLTAEVLYDVFHQVTNSSQRFSGLPADTKAIQITDATSAPYFLKVFGQPQADTACECERSQSANLAQSLHLLNSKEVQDKITGASSRAAMLAKDTKRTDEEKVKELYRWVYARAPKDEEMKFALSYIARHKEKPQIAYEDIIWALINTKEFLFNH